MARSYRHVKNLTGVAGMEGWSTSSVDAAKNYPNIFVVFDPGPVRKFWADNGFPDLVKWLDGKDLVLFEHDDEDKGKGHIWVKMY